MSRDSDLIKLYSKRILALATSIPHTRRLDDPHASAKERSPLCGSTVTVDIDVEDNRVVRFGQSVKACALGQAAASVVGSRIIGLSRDQIMKGLIQLQGMLKNDGPIPDPPFEGLEVLVPARDYKNRHASILLALTATLRAFDLATESRARGDLGRETSSLL